jgi:hypothetical protein
MTDAIEHRRYDHVSAENERLRTERDNLRGALVRATGRSFESIEEEFGSVGALTDGGSPRVDRLVQQIMDDHDPTFVIQVHDEIRAALIRRGVGDTDPSAICSAGHGYPLP